ncbi:AAC(3)-I family aminoglycoside 3-N-acetyltransferase [Candidatus Saccharibacteria bacterium]|nr:MAG: AAC(3)-I family aminoglycoside 3-N-acetyltransferase [Candidatus Saccharibacteria bacterium]PID99040.1 MAG: AAC(3)-I family aminoglycoside 3-N-acetyltransferase [Candidatus Saccharibacteria bacterium]
MKRSADVKKLNRNDVSDFKSLVEIFADVFENDQPISDDEHLSTLLANPDFLAFVVKQDQKVIGGLTLYVLHGYYGTRPAAYIYDVGITPEFQGQGLGKLLMAEVREYCKDNGFAEVYVEAESDDSDAVNFYRKTEYSNETNVVQFTYSFDDEK